MCYSFRLASARYLVRALSFSLSLSLSRPTHPPIHPFHVSALKVETTAHFFRITFRIFLHANFDGEVARVKIESQVEDLPCDPENLSQNLNFTLSR